MNTYNDDLVELEYGGVYILKNSITLELYDPESEDEECYITMLIGDIEATNIIYAAENDIFDFIENDTHDFILESLDQFNIRIAGILIVDEHQGKWQAQIELINLSDNSKTYIECRPTDALILSLKENIPLMIKKDLLHKKNSNNVKNIDVKDSIDFDNDENLMQSFDKINVSKLEERLDQYVKEEKYEEAAKIKIQIDKIKGEN